MLPTRRIGTTDLHVPILGFGGAPLGDLYHRIDEATAQATIEAAWSSGVRLFDTAPLYGYGLSEHRFGHALRQRPRDQYVLSTKVGRRLVPTPPERIDRGQWTGGLNMQPVTDYTADGTRRAFEDSLQRLGVGRIDIVFIHDVDVWTHGTKEAYDARYRECIEGAYPVLHELRAQGLIRAIGLGVNEIEPCLRFLRDADPDVFLLAGRYTLLEQEGLADLLPEARRRHVSFLLGGPYNSGILATGPVDGARYNYKPAPPDILERVGRIEAVCTRHAVPLKAAAIRFPLGLPEVAAIVPGGVTAAEVQDNERLIRTAIPMALWAELKAEGLLSSDCPVPTDA